MNTNLFSKLNNTLIIAILYYLSACDFLHCIITCRLLYEYGNNNRLIGKLCQEKLVELIPDCIKTLIETVTIPYDELFLGDQIVVSKLFCMLDLQSIGLPEYSKKWFLKCMLVNIDTLKKKKSYRKSIRNGLIKQIDGYWLYYEKIFIGELKTEYHSDDIIYTPVKGMLISKYSIKIGIFNKNQICTGFEITNNYIGQISEDDRHGLGTCILYKNICIGQWKHNYFHGKCYVRYISGTVYDGNWIRNVRYGKGKCTFSNGSVYNGDWVNDERDGYGIFTTPHGMKYEGFCKNNQCHGLGTVYHNDGSLWKGEWLYGLPVNDDALHIHIQKLINNNQCTKIMADKPGKYAQILYKREYDPDEKFICKVCLDTCYLINKDKMKPSWTTGYKICNCPCKIIEKTILK